MNRRDFLKSLGVAWLAISVPQLPQGIESPKKPDKFSGEEWGRGITFSHVSEKDIALQALKSDAYNTLKKGDKYALLYVGEVDFGRKHQAAWYWSELTQKEALDEMTVHGELVDYFTV